MILTLLDMFNSSLTNSVDWNVVDGVVSLLSPSDPHDPFSTHRGDEAMRCEELEVKYYTDMYFASGGWKNCSKCFIGPLSELLIRGYSVSLQRK